MNTFDLDVRELQKRLSDGLVQRAYRRIVSYMSRLRTAFVNLRGEGATSGLYQGYFDMTYFAVFSDRLKERGLKLAVVFNYEPFGFEVWLAARNRKVQRQYWELLFRSGYRKYQLIEPAVGTDAIVTATLGAECSMSDVKTLTEHIIKGVTQFEQDIVSFLETACPYDSANFNCS